MQKSKKIIAVLALSCWLLSLRQGASAQQYKPPIDTVSLNVDRLFELVIQNNPTLKVATADIAVAEQGVKVAKNNRLPNADISSSAFYLSDVNIFSPDFKTDIRQEMPHFGHNTAVGINQLLWKGGLVKEHIRLTELQVDIANLQYTSAEQQARLTVLGYYLDLYKLNNQTKVYQQNIELAEKRVKNIKTMYNQGMVTRNDVIRADLLNSNLKLAKLTVDNNILVLNNQLRVAIGLPENTVVIPNEAVLQIPAAQQGEEAYVQVALQHNPNVLLTQKALDISQSAINIAHKNWYPSLAAFAGNTRQRPVTGSTPALDMYANTWNAGLALNFDIGSLWKNRKEVGLRQSEMKRALAQKEEVEAMISVGVNAAYIKHKEAIVQKSTLTKNVDLANENYRIMETKYNNQLALIIDLLDASNAKLDAELQYTNAEINIIYAYYKLLKEAGSI